MHPDSLGHAETDDRALELRLEAGAVTSDSAKDDRCNGEEGDEGHGLIRKLVQEVAIDDGKHVLCGRQALSAVSSAMVAISRHVKASNRVTSCWNSAMPWSGKFAGLRVRCECEVQCSESCAASGGAMCVASDGACAPEKRGDSVKFEQ